MEKNTLRESIKHRLSDLTPQHRAQQSQKVIQYLEAIYTQRIPQAVGIFLPLADEPDLSEWYSQLERAGVVLWAPSEDVDGNPCLVRYASSMETVVKNGRRRPLPVEEQWNDADGEVDLLLVPGRAFTLSGARLGRGRGRYDRRIVAHPGVYTVGVCFSCQIVDRLPMDQGDRSVDVVVVG